MHEKDGVVTKTEYLNDSQSITGYSQVLKQTETNIVSGDEKVTTYIIGLQRISQTISENGAEQEYFFTYDGHGSTRVLLNAAGTVAQLYSFDAYGNAIGFNVNEALTEFLYSGEQFDSKIGQQYLRQRYYDATTGRFNRLDPFFGNLNDPQSLHKYAYTHADPVNGVDPSGEFSIAFGLGGFLAGGLHVGIALGATGSMAIALSHVTAGVALQAIVITPLCYALAGTNNENLIGLALVLRYLSPGLGPLANAISHLFYSGDSWLPNISTIIFDMSSVQQAVKSSIEKMKNGQYSETICDVPLNGGYGTNRRGEIERDSILRWALGTGEVEFKVNYFISGPTQTGGRIANVTWTYKDEFDAKSFLELYRSNEFRRLNLDTESLFSYIGSIISATGEGAFDLLVDKVLQQWYYFQVSETKTIAW